MKITKDNIIEIVCKEYKKTKNTRKVLKMGELTETYDTHGSYATKDYFPNVIVTNYNKSSINFGTLPDKNRFLTRLSTNQFGLYPASETEFIKIDVGGTNNWITESDIYEAFQVNRIHGLSMLCIYDNITLANPNTLKINYINLKTGVVGISSQTGSSVQLKTKLKKLIEEFRTATVLQKPVDNLEFKFNEILPKFTKPNICSTFYDLSFTGLYKYSNEDDYDFGAYFKMNDASSRTRLTNIREIRYWYEEKGNAITYDDLLWHNSGGTDLTVLKADPDQLVSTKIFGNFYKIESPFHFHWYQYFSDGNVVMPVDNYYIKMYGSIWYPENYTFNDSEFVFEFGANKSIYIPNGFDKSGVLGFGKSDVSTLTSGEDLQETNDILHLVYNQKNGTITKTMEITNDVRYFYSNLSKYVGAWQGRIVNTDKVELLIGDDFGAEIALGDAGQSGLNRANINDIYLFGIYYDSGTSAYKAEFISSRVDCNKTGGGWFYYNDHTELWNALPSTTHIQVKYDTLTGAFTQAKVLLTTPTGGSIQRWVYCEVAFILDGDHTTYLVKADQRVGLVFDYDYTFKKDTYLIRKSESLIDKLDLEKELVMNIDRTFLGFPGITYKIGDTILQNPTKKSCGFYGKLLNNTELDTTSSANLDIEVVITVDLGDTISDVYYTNLTWNVVSNANLWVYDNDFAFTEVVPTIEETAITFFTPTHRYVIKDCIDDTNMYWLTDNLKYSQVISKTSKKDLDLFEKKGTWRAEIILKDGVDVSDPTFLDDLDIYCVKRRKPIGAFFESFPLEIDVETYINFTLPVHKTYINAPPDVNIKEDCDMIVKFFYSGINKSLVAGDEFYDNVRSEQDQETFMVAGADLNNSVCLEIFKPGGIGYETLDNEKFIVEVEGGVSKLETTAEYYFEKYKGFSKACGYNIGRYVPGIYKLRVKSSSADVISGYYTAGELYHGITMELRSRVNTEILTLNTTNLTEYVYPPKWMVDFHYLVGAPDPASGSNTETFKILITGLEWMRTSPSTSTFTSPFTGINTEVIFNETTLAIEGTTTTLTENLLHSVPSTGQQDYVLFDPIKVKKIVEGDVYNAADIIGMNEYVIDQTDGDFFAYPAKPIVDITPLTFHQEDIPYLRFIDNNNDKIVIDGFVQFLNDVYTNLFIMNRDDMVGQKTLIRDRSMIKTYKGKTIMTLSDLKEYVLDSDGGSMCLADGTIYDNVRVYANIPLPDDYLLRFDQPRFYLNTKYENLIKETIHLTSSIDFDTFPLKWSYLFKHIFKWNNSQKYEFSKFKNDLRFRSANIEYDSIKDSIIKVWKSTTNNILTDADIFHLSTIIISKIIHPYFKENVHIYEAWSFLEISYKEALITWDIRYLQLNYDEVIRNLADLHDDLDYVFFHEIGRLMIYKNNIVKINDIIENLGNHIFDPLNECATLIADAVTAWTYVPTTGTKTKYLTDLFNNNFFANGGIPVVIPTIEAVLLPKQDYLISIIQEFYSLSIDEFKSTTQQAILSKIAGTNPLTVDILDRRIDKLVTRIQELERHLTITKHTNK